MVIGKKAKPEESGDWLWVGLPLVEEDRRE